MLSWRLLPWGRGTLSNSAALEAATRSRTRLFGRLFAVGVGLTLSVALGAAATILVWPSAPTPPRPPAAEPTRKQAAALQPTQAIRVAAGRPVVIGVFGDSLGDGVWWGLDQQLRGDKTYQVIRFSRASTGLSSYQYVNIHDAAAAQLATQPIDVAVIMVGANDEQGIEDAGHVYAFGTPGWLSVYERRIDDLVALLRLHGAAIYWVGLPKMRHATYDARAQFLNDIFASRARAQNVTFIPTVPVTVDARGDYDDYLPEGPGARPRLMRAKDGIHLTMAGYRRLAGPALAVIRADLRWAPAAPVSELASRN
jgi:uncharacterized protein